MSNQEKAMMIAEAILIKRALTETYPTGIVSYVADSYDYFRLLTGILPMIKDTITSRNGKLVIRPDSGDPVDIICGLNSNPNANGYVINSPETKGSIELLWDLFGGTINSKGYKQLDPHIGLIYGDSITLERAEQICERLEKKGFACTNIVTGIGSFSYQYNTRDTFGQAIKATYGVVNKQPINIFKKPKTDNGLKNSAKGLLYVDSNFNLEQEVTPEREADPSNMLKLVFKDGKIVKQFTLAEVRENLRRANA